MGLAVCPVPAEVTVHLFPTPASPRSNTSALLLPTSKIQQVLQGTQQEEVLELGSTVHTSQWGGGQDRHRAALRLSGRHPHLLRGCSKCGDNQGLLTGFLILILHRCSCLAILSEKMHLFPLKMTMSDLPHSKVRLCSRD